MTQGLRAIQLAVVTLALAGGLRAAPPEIIVTAMAAAAPTNRIDIVEGLLTVADRYHGGPSSFVVGTAALPPRARGPP